MNSRQDVLDEALDRLAAHDYLVSGGFVCHGPMGAEALSTLGYDDLVATWVDDYRSRSTAITPPGTVAVIDPDDEQLLHEALGDPTRISDWEVMFHEVLQRESWTQVVTEWSPRLMHGHGGALGHGVIRTAHAVRAMPAPPQSPSRLRLHELSQALALWAATFHQPPSAPHLTGTANLRDAFNALPRADRPPDPLTPGSMDQLGNVNGFATAVRGLRHPAAADDALSNLSLLFCEAILANPDVFVIPLIHTVTPIGAVRTLLPYMPQGALDTTYAQLWHAGAAIMATCTPATVIADREPRPAPIEPAEIVADAVQHRDPHVIKFTQACLHEHQLNPHVAYLHAARHVINQIPAWATDTAAHEVPT